MTSRFARVAVLTFCCSLLALPTTAARRRPINAGPQPPVTGNCHTFSLVKAGTKASYLSTTSGGNVTYTITWISDTPTQTRTTQKVTTPQATADAETRVDGEIVGNLRAIKHIYTKTTVPAPMIGNVTTEVDIDFVPSLAAGPAGGWCAGATWDIPPSTETITSKSLAGQNTTVVTTVASRGEVLAVGENVTVPAGTFKTVKYKSLLVSSGAPQPSITWTSMDHSVVVRQETFDANGNVDTTTVLTSLQ